MPAEPESASDFSARFLAEVQLIAARLDTAAIEKTAVLLDAVRQRGGRLFILGVGGSAANASHAVNDFRKLTGMEAYAPTDNVSELTARVNDEGWSGVFEAWLRTSRLREQDAVLVLSVGGGNRELNVSPNLVAALEFARAAGASIAGIVGRDGGYTARVADTCILIPTVHPAHITPHAEAFQAVVWHLLVSHPLLRRAPARWESLAPSNTLRAVFLDRDGVLNAAVIRDGKPYPPSTPNEVRIPPGTAESLARLKQKGFLLLVVTNQPDVARGSQQRDVVEEIHRRLRAALPVDAFFTCYHDDADGCECRKPAPGLLRTAAADYGVDLSRSYMVGDRWRDIEAGTSAGCKTIWIDPGYTEQAARTSPDARVTSLTQAVDWILATCGEPA